MLFPKVNLAKDIIGSKIFIQKTSNGGKHRRQFFQKLQVVMLFPKVNVAKHIIGAEVRILTS